MIFSDIKSEAQTTKEKIDKLDFIKLKLCAKKDTIKKVIR